MEAVIMLLLLVSMASERIVEMLKGMIPGLADQHPRPNREQYRKAFIQLLSIAVGIGLTYMAHPIVAPELPPGWRSDLAIVAIGVMSSGGSGLWNVVLTYLLEVKNLKKAVAQGATAEASTLQGALPNLLLAGEQVTSNECFDVEENSGNEILEEGTWAGVLAKP